jgi:phosphoribosyl 1,2-cyclic phosphodiesterase
VSRPARKASVTAKTSIASGPEPAPGRFRFVILGSGSSGNATLIEAGETRILLDAGLGPRSLAERLYAAGVEPSSLSAVLLTHEHNDHSRGAGAFSKRWRVPLYASRGTRAALPEVKRLAESFEVFAESETLRIGTLRITALPIPHDAVEPCAFLIASGEQFLGHATDLGHVPTDLAQTLGACHALVLESNYDASMLRAGPYPWALKERIASQRGHTSNTEIARFVKRHLGEACGTLVLAHLSETNNNPDVARYSVEPVLREIGISALRLEVAPRLGGDWIEIVAHRKEAPDKPQLTLW